MVTGFELVLVLLVVLAIAVTLYWWRQPPSHAALPSLFCERDSQEAGWRERYGDERLEIADAVLLLVCDAFCFNPEERHKLKPDTAKRLYPGAQSAAFRGVTLGARRAPDASGESKATTHAGVRRARNNPRFASVHTGRRVFRSRNTRVWLMIYGSTEA